MEPYQLPLFPLNSVLFPGIPIFLHIFEPRYQAMINFCIDEQKPFGVVLIKSSKEAFGMAEPCEIGCSADIVQVEQLEHGRKHIVAVGKERFRILHTNSTQSYLQGEVEPYPLKTITSNQQLENIATALRVQVTNYVDTLREISDVEMHWDELPDDNTELAYLAAYVLQVHSNEKQEFLTEGSVFSILKSLQTAYRQELHLLSAMIEQKRLHPAMDDMIFSLN